MANANKLKEILTKILLLLLFAEKNKNKIYQLNHFYAIDHKN